MIQTVTISSQRQITIPVSMLTQLGLKKQDKLVLKVDGDLLVAKPGGKNVVDRLAGSLKQYIPKEKIIKNWKQVREETKKLVAIEAANEG